MKSILTQRATRRPQSSKDWKLVPLQHRGVNQSALATSNTHGEWFIKICRDPGSVPDICEREELASLLGEMAEVPVVDAFCVPTATFGAVAELFPLALDLMTDRCVAMHRIAGSTVSLDPEGASRFIRSHPDKLADIFAFSLWIGDEDRGLDDVMLENGSLVLIDNGLSGPGRSSVLRSAHPAECLYRPIDVTRMCFPFKKSFVEFAIRRLSEPNRQLAVPKVIDRIAGLRDTDLEQAVLHSQLPPWMASALVQRRDTLGDDYVKWLKAAADLS